MSLLSFRFDRHVDFLIDAKIVTMYFVEAIIIEIGRGGQFGELDVRMECQIVSGEIGIDEL
jgi:hypothetical protein